MERSNYVVSTRQGIKEFGCTYTRKSYLYKRLLEVRTDQNKAGATNEDIHAIGQNAFVAGNRNEKKPAALDIGCSSFFQETS